MTGVYRLLIIVVSKIMKLEIRFPNLDPKSRPLLIFRYNMVLSSILPNKGSYTGGTTVTIQGNGFGDSAADTKVTLGDANCKVQSVNMSSIVCITSNYTVSTVALKVSGYRGGSRNTLKGDRYFVRGLINAVS